MIWNYTMAKFIKICHCTVYWYLKLRQRGASRHPATYFWSYCFSILGWTDPFYLDCGFPAGKTTGYEVTSFEIFIYFIIEPCLGYKVVYYMGIHQSFRVYFIVTKTIESAVIAIKQHIAILCNRNPTHWKQYLRWPDSLDRRWGRPITLEVAMGFLVIVAIHHCLRIALVPWFR